ncbi:MAG: IS30 family transposase, partial [Nocardioides sp.]
TAQDRRPQEPRGGPQEACLGQDRGLTSNQSVNDQPKPLRQESTEAEQPYQVKLQVRMLRAGYGAEAMHDALAAQMTTIPEQLRRSPTWDRGKELAQHAQFTIETGIAVYFADPHSPWQRGTNENTNGLLRQYLPKGTDLARWSAEDLEAVAATLNGRPRKALTWKTPAEALDDQIASLYQAGPASTG